MMDRVPYASLMGSLIFAMVCTTPDIAYSVGESPKKKASRKVKHISSHVYSSYHNIPWSVVFRFGVSVYGLFGCTKTSNSKHNHSIISYMRFAFTDIQVK